MFFGEFTDKKSNLVCIQWFVVIAASYLILFRSGQITQDPLSYLLIVAAFGSILALQRMPRSVFDHRMFPIILVVVDTLLISTAITLNRESPWDLLLLFFFAIFIAAIGESLLQIVTGCIALSVISIFIGPLSSHGEFQLAADHLLRIPLLFGLSLVYGYLVDQVKREKKKLVELEEAKRQQLLIKDQFLSHVSHELRSPLSAIYQFVTILKDGLAGELNGEQRDYLGIVLRNIKQLQSMIDELLEVTRAATGKLAIHPQRVAVADLLSETLGMLLPTAAVKNITLSADASYGLPPAYADPQRLKQVLINLVDNAIKFTPANGTVTVRAGLLDPDPNFLCLSVADTGCGISPEGTQRIFERLYQETNSIETSRKGLGLGLHICKELVTNHGGRIWVESHLGRGSVFYFTLPIFSLSKLLYPIVTENNRLKDPISLITVKLFVHAGASLTDVTESTRRAACNVLQRFISPNGMLLPTLSDAREGVAFHIVECSPQDSAKATVRHVQEQLGQCEDLQVPSLGMEVSETVVDTSPSQPSSSLDELVENVATRITELVNAEVAKEIKGERTNVFAAMSQEVRTPLSVVVGYAGVLRDKLLGHLNAEQENALNKVVRYTNDLILMVNNVVEVQKIESGTVKVDLYKVHLANLFDDLKAIYESQLTETVNMIWDYPSELPAMTTDGVKLKGILQNLIQNAIKFTPKGSVTISAGYDSQTESVEFAVADTGLGITTEALPAIFDKFHKVSRLEINLMGGMGLGLYIVKTLTERLGGKVEVESALGKGSIFKVRLPLDPHSAISKIEKVDHFINQATTQMEQ
jgi:signal transduction histidine kinase